MPVPVSEIIEQRRATPFTEVLASAIEKVLGDDPANAYTRYEIAKLVQGGLGFDKDTRLFSLFGKAVPKDVRATVNATSEEFNSALAGVLESGALKARFHNGKLLFWSTSN